MLCKKCKTSIINNEKTCSYCGALVRSGKGAWLIYALITCVVIVFFIALDGLLYDSEKDDDTHGVAPAVTDTNPGNGNKTASNGVNPTPFTAFDSDEDAEQVIAMIENVAAAAYEYVKDGTKYVYYLSKNGYLYDDVNNMYITISDLVDIEVFDDDYAGENVLILYLLTNEFTLTAEEDGNRLEVFTAYETVRGFYLASPRGYIGIISREALRDLLNRYAQDHGQITRYEPDSNEFRDISEAILRYTNASGKLLARYIAGDGLHAFAVVSFEGRDNEVNEYALVNNDVWSVFCSDFEDRYDYKYVVNTANPNFNPDLFPAYNMYFHNKYIRKGFDDILTKLIENEYISGDSKPVYASGSDLFSYLEFANGRKLLCYTPGDKEISVYPISNYKEGENLMNVLTQDPPYYIFKQD